MRPHQSGEYATRLRDLLQSLVMELVDNPKEASVTSTVSEGGNTIVLTIRTANGEIGKVIGRQGRNAHALRILLEAIAAKYKQRVVLEIDDRRKRRDGNRFMERGRRTN